MLRPKIEKVFKYKGLECVILFTTSAHRCGYVAVEKTSPLYKINSSEDLKNPELLKELKQAPIGKRGIIDIFCWEGEKITPSILFNVHGGITYSNGGTCYPITRDRQLWWFGFDCAHAGDAKDWETLKKYYPKEFWISFWENDNKYLIQTDVIRPQTDVIRTQTYVEQECKNLVEQILCVESTY